MATVSSGHEPINHSRSSSAATTAWSAAKWGGAVALIAAVAAVALTVGLGGATLIGSYAILTASTASATTTGGLTAGVVGAATAFVVGSVATTASVFLTISTLANAGLIGIGGGLFGAHRGSRRVALEREAYQERFADHLNLRYQQLANLNNGYRLDPSDVELQRMNELHEMAAQGEKYDAGQHTGNAVKEAVNAAAAKAVDGATPKAISK